jgi:hypothetical protein
VRTCVQSTIYQDIKNNAITVIKNFAGSKNISSVPIFGISSDLPSKDEHALQRYWIEWQKKIEAGFVVQLRGRRNFCDFRLTRTRYR